MYDTQVMFKETVRKQNKVKLCVGGHRSRPRKFSTQSYFATLTLGLPEPEKDQISAKASTYLFNYDKHRLRLRKIMLVTNSIPSSCSNSY